jgi:hypothetical protein
MPAVPRLWRGGSGVGAVPAGAAAESSAGGGRVRDVPSLWRAQARAVGWGRLRHAAVALVWLGSALGSSLVVETRSAPMIFVGQSSETGRPAAGVTLLARSRLAERMQAIRDESQRLAQDIVSAAAATSRPAEPESEQPLKM